MASLFTPRSRSRFRRGASPILILSVAGFTTCAALAQSTATIPGSTAAGVALAAAANYKTSQDSKWKDYEDVVILNILNGVAKAAANAGQQLSAAQYTSIATQVRTFLDAKLPSNPVFADETACLRYAINSLVCFNNAASVNTFLPAAIGRLENLKYAMLEAPLNPSRQTPSDLATYSVAANAFPFIAAQVQEASDLAHANAQFAAAVNPVMIDLVGLDTSASYAQIQSAFPNAVPTLPAPGSDGSYTISTQTLLTQYQTIISDVAATTDAHLTSIESQASSFASQQSRSRMPDANFQAAGPTASTPCTAGTSTNGKIVISADDCTASNGKPPDYWSLSQTAVTGISKLAGYADPQLGTQIANVGGALIQGAKAVAQIDGIISAGSIFSSLAPALALAGPVGALVGAGATIFSTFFSSSSGGNQASTAAILQQIQKLSQQITRLQQDMTNRFNQVDAKLNTILATLNSNFALINYQLGVLNGDARAIQAGLLDIQSQLNQLQQYTLAYSQAQSKATLISQMNGCLNYAAVHNGADIGQLQYNGCENNFYSWSHDNALDQLWAGLVQPSYSDSNVYNTFFNFPLSVNVNYLTQFSGQNLGIPTLSSARIANPNEWVLGARAYLELAHEWRQYATQINSSRLDDLIQIGTNLQQAAQNANSIHNGTLVPNQNLFTTLAIKYTTAASGLQNAVQSIASTFVADPSKRLQGLNLWGGASQQTSYAPQVLSSSLMPPCSITYTNFRTPLNLSPTLIPMQVRLAEQLGLGTLSFCYNMELSGIRPPRPGEFGYGYNILYSTMRFAVVGSFGAKEVFRRMLPLMTNSLWCATASPYPNCPLADGTDPTVTKSGAAYFMDGFWQDSNHFGGMPLYYQTFATISIDDSENAALRSANLLNLSASIDSTLRSYQKGLYGQIAGAFSAAGPVQVAGQLLTGAKLLEQGYANFGLPNYVQNNALRALLYGNQSILDAASVQADFAAFAAASIPDTTDNKITDEFAAVNSRLTTLSTAITAALNQIQQNQRPDSLPEIDLMLEDLRAFQTLKNSGGLSFCTYQISSSSGSVGGPGGTAVLTVNTANGCTLLPASSSPWVQMTTTALSSGQIQVSITAAPNSSGSVRSGVVIVGDQVYRLLQDTSPTSCTYSLSAQTISVGRSASTGSVGVVAPVGCSWSAVSNDPSWLTISSGATGTGNGSIGYSFLANPSAASRSGSLFIAGLTFTVNQAGSASGPSKVGVYRTGQWYLDASGSGAINSNTKSFSLGFPGATFMTGDWNGDGKTKVGVYSNGYWFLDYDGNGVWDGGVNDKLVAWGWAGATPVVGDWNGNGKTKIGVYSNGFWFLDYNGDYLWDGGVVDKQVGWGWAGVTPMVGDWNGDGKTKIGIYVNGYWFLDYNGDYLWDGGVVDKQVGWGWAGVTPIVGDWNGDGKTKIGVYAGGYWYIDYDGNYLWEYPAKDKIWSLGWTGTTPVMGDWNGDGKTKPGAFINGYWYLDYNGNGIFDGAGTDRIYAFGASGDTPVVGRW